MALILTIVVLVILATITIQEISGDGIFTKAQEAVRQHKKESYKEQIGLAYFESIYNVTATSKEKFNEIAQKLQNNENIEVEGLTAGSRFLIIKTKDGNIFTLLEDGTILEQKVAILDIADGHIDLYEKGYKQYTGKLQNINKNNIINYSGEYIITGTTKENVVRVCDIGTYNITIKDLNIDVSSAIDACAINANRGDKITDLYVTINIEGENNLIARSPGIGFAKGTPNLNGVTNGSTLTIQGNGKLNINTNGGHSAAIGSGYTGYEACAGSANNIIINSGTIITKSNNGCGIGGALGANANNIVINGGNITANASVGCAIGSRGTTDTIIINGGNIIACGNHYGSAIGGATAKNIIIKGGVITATFGGWRKDTQFWHSAIGSSATNTSDDNITIEGGTVIAKTTGWGGIYSKSGNIRITGGNIYSTGSVSIGKQGEAATTIVEAIPTDGTNNLYLTKLKLDGITEKKQINKITTSDNINYGTKDMFTTEDGMLYLYLPEGTRNINIQIEHREYEGNVTTIAGNGEIFSISVVEK